MDSIIIGFSIPLIGTTIGAATVFLIRDKIGDKTQKMMLGFASGIMMAACFWSLLQPAMEQSGSGLGGLLPILSGFILGMGFLFILDSFVPHQHIDNNNPEGIHSSLPRSIKLMMAVALHNIPEGMAIGAVFAGVAGGDESMSYAAALALSIGMAIQNIPEGAIISIPLRTEGKSRKRAFLMGALSGLVEPLAAIATLLFLGSSTTTMPLLLSFAAGAMLYVIIEELIPSSQSGKHSNVGTIGFAIGFATMMILDCVL
ncbi:MAG: ZIP family metal transporter [Bacteroidaceae bacterium]|nr:ZIP family metal transporter [Bacteroidaceae bacterium]